MVRGFFELSMITMLETVIYMKSITIFRAIYSLYF